MKKIHRILFGVLLTLVFFQFVSIASLISKTSGTKAVISVLSDDDSVNVGVALKTRLWNDNSFQAYGVVYYRLTHIIATLISPRLETVDDSIQAQKETGHHFIMLTINLVALYGIAFIIAFALLKRKSDQLFLTAALVSAFLSNPTWLTFLLRPHPEILFSFFLLLAIYWTIIFFHSANEADNKKTAFSWGIVLSTKLTTVLFAPAVALIVIIKFFKNSPKKIFQFILFTLLAYFIVGFPQNFLIHKTYGFFLTLNKYSAPTTIESISIFLINTYEQAKIPFLVLSIFSLLLPRKENKYNPFILVGFFVLPLLLLILRNSQLPMQHYTLGFAALFLLIAVYFIQKIPQISYPSKTLPDLFIVALITGLVLTLGFSPRSISATLKEKLKCRNETYELIKRLDTNYNQILVDPYTPITGASPKVLFSWHHTLDDIDPNMTDRILINKIFSARFITGKEPSPYVITDTPNWQEVRKYYQLFLNKDQVKDSYSQSWNKVFDKCSIELWEKK